MRAGRKEKMKMRRLSPTGQIRRCRNIRRSTDRLPEKCDIAFGRGISAGLRSVALNHDDLYCQMCGVMPGDIDDLTGRHVKFHIERVKAKKLGGQDELSNLRALCSTCYRGAKDLYKERTSDNWRLSQVGLEGEQAQRPVLSALLKEIGEAK